MQVAADVRYAFRVLRRSPALLAAAVVTLALGIGANTTVFSLANAIVLQPLTFDRENRIVSAEEISKDGQELKVSRLDFDDWQARARSFEAMAVYTAAAANLTGDLDARRIMAASVTPGFFRVFHVQPVIGRTFGDPGKESATPVVISEGLWRSAFGGRKDVLGRILSIDQNPTVVVGVMPAVFDYPFTPHVWMPLDLSKDGSARSAHNFAAIARLRPGVSVAAAQAEMSAVAAQIARENPDGKTSVGAKVTLLHDDLTSFFRPTLVLFVAAAIFVLLIACVNVANIMMAHVRGRTGDIAVRAALGATRRRIVQQVLTETLVLASIGGALGVLVAFWVSRLLMLSPAVRFALRGQSLFSIDVLLFAGGITLLAALLCGAIPALRVARVDLTATLRRASGRAHSDRMRRLFVISEIAVSLALLVGAGLLTRSLLRIVNRPFGFDPSNLTIVEATGSAAGVQLNEFADQVSRRLERIPGVTAVAVMNELPVSGEATTGAFVLEGSDERDQAKWPYAIWHVVNDDYFRTLGVPIVRGRGFRPSDAGGPSAVIISDAAAKRFWPGVDPIGRRLAIPGLDQKTFLGYRDGKQDWMTVVGVAGDTLRPGSQRKTIPELYVPFLQRPPETPLLFLVRSKLPAGVLQAGVIHAVHSVARNVPVGVKSLDNVIGRSLSMIRVRSLAVEIFAALALLLASVGVYGLTANWVQQRRSEIGVRLALGAQRRDIVTLIVGRVMLLTAVGLLAGIALAVPMTGMLRSFLFDVSPTDALTFIVAVSAILVSSLIASVVPLRHAVTVDPVVTLRYE